MANLAFIDFWSLVDRHMTRIYGVDSSAVGLSAEELAHAQDAGDRPLEYVKWFGRHYDLIPVKAWTYELATNVLKGKQPCTRN